MTDTDLRELFRAAAPDVEGHDPATIDRAWRDGVRRRLGASTAVTGTVAAAAATVVGVAALGGPGGRETPAPPIDSSTPTPTSASVPTGPPVAEPAGDYAGAEVWWAPSVGEETSLPMLPGSPLPEVIDLEAARVEAVGEPVAALFAGRGERAYALTASQRVVEIDTSRLDPLTDEEGNGRNPLSSYSLSSDRLHAFFVQQSSLEVLDLVTGEWTSVDTPDWLAEGARWVARGEIWVPVAVEEESSGTIHQVEGGRTSLADVDWVRGWVGPDDEPFGPVAAGPSGTAQAAFTVMSLPNRITAPQALMVDQRGARSVLALDHLGAGGSGSRSKGCCVALGWLDDDTVLFSSFGTEGQRILAWRPGTAEIYRVSEVLGRGSIAALADPPPA